MAAAGATPEDVAKTLLIQTILKQRGVSSGKKIMITNFFLNKLEKNSLQRSSVKEAHICPFVSLWDG